MALSNQVKKRRANNRARRRAWAVKEVRENGRRVRALVQEVAQSTTNRAVEMLLGPQWHDAIKNRGPVVTALFRPGFTQVVTEDARKTLTGVLGNLEKDYAQFMDDSVITDELRLGTAKWLSQQSKTQPPMMDKETEAMVSKEYLDTMKISGFLTTNKPPEKPDGSQ